MGAIAPKNPKLCQISLFSARSQQSRWGAHGGPSGLRSAPKTNFWLCLWYIIDNLVCVRDLQFWATLQVIMTRRATPQKYSLFCVQLKLSVTNFSRVVMKINN